MIHAYTHYVAGATQTVTRSGCLVSPLHKMFKKNMIQRDSATLVCTFADSTCVCFFFIHGMSTYVK